MNRVAVALVHYPVLDKSQRLVATNITNYDIHDIARACRSYGVEKYYLVHPGKDQQIFVHRILEHWKLGFGAKYNPSRRRALELIKTVDNLEQARIDFGPDTKLVATSAKDGPDRISYESMRGNSEDIMIVLGTGYGLTQDVMGSCDYVLKPIKSEREVDYLHLSVRSAASIILDRLMGG